MSTSQSAALPQNPDFSTMETIISPLAAVQAAPAGFAQQPLHYAEAQSFHDINAIQPIQTLPGARLIQSPDAFQSTNAFQPTEVIPAFVPVQAFQPVWPGGVQAFQPIQPVGVQAFEPFQATAAAQGLEAIQATVTAQDIEALPPTGPWSEPAITGQPRQSYSDRGCLYRTVQPLPPSQIYQGQLHPGSQNLFRQPLPTSQTPPSAVEAEQPRVLQTAFVGQAPAIQVHLDSGLCQSATPDGPQLQPGYGPQPVLDSAQLMGQHTVQPGSLDLSSIPSEASNQCLSGIPGSLPATTTPAETNQPSPSTDPNGVRSAPLDANVRSLTKWLIETKAFLIPNLNLFDPTPVHRKRTGRAPNRGRVYTDRARPGLGEHACEHCQQRFTRPSTARRHARETCKSRPM